MNISYILKILKKFQYRKIEQILNKYIHNRTKFKVEKLQGM